MQKRFEQGAYGAAAGGGGGDDREAVQRGGLERVTQGADEEDLVNSGLEETMIDAYHPSAGKWKQRKGAVDMRTAAMIVAIDKVALSYIQRGIFP